MQLKQIQKKPLDQQCLCCSHRTSLSLVFLSSLFLVHDVKNITSVQTFWGGCFFLLFPWRGLGTSKLTRVFKTRLWASLGSLHSFAAVPGDRCKEHFTYKWFPCVRVCCGLSLLTSFDRSTHCCFQKARCLRHPSYSTEARKALSGLGGWTKGERGWCVFTGHWHHSCY